MVIKLKVKPIGLTLLFLLGILCLYLGFNGVSSQSSRQEDRNPGSGAVQVNAPDSAFFVNYRQEREIQRQQQRDILTELINSPAAAAETRQSAQKQLLELSQTAAKEGELESLILAKGFKDVVATINEGGVNLTVYGERFSQEEITKLQDIAVRTSGVRLENIVLVPRT